MDFGYTNDPTATIALYKWNNAYILDEVFCTKGLLNSAINNVLKANNVTGTIAADLAEPKSIAELRFYGHDIIGAAKGKDSIIYGIGLLNQNEIYVTSRSKNLINELHNYVWVKDKNGDKGNKPIDAFNHCIDAARYALSSELDNPTKGQYFIS